MKNDFSSILYLSHVIEQSLNATFQTCFKVSCMYKAELPKFPLMIDLLGEALHSEVLKETAHSRILYKLLQYKEIQTSFIERFLPNVDCSFETIQIPYPDKNRIDLTIKSDKFFLIIENKINGAYEQPEQIDKYVRIAKQTCSEEEIYVLYLGGETNMFPSEYSLSLEYKQLLQDRIICINYKTDITPWIEEVYEQTNFENQPYLKSTLLCYKTYMENKYNINTAYKEMNHKLDKTIAEMLQLDTMPVEEKIKVIEDQIDNIDKISERLSSMLEEYRKESERLSIQDWYKQCSESLSYKPILTMKDETEFGFNFMYRNTEFRCCVSFDDYENPYWGVMGIKENTQTRPKIFESLRDLVLQSNKGFHNCEDNSKEWAVSDYESKELIADRFIELARLIYNSEACTIVEKPQS